MKANESKTKHQLTKLTNPAKASVALEGLKQQHLGVDSQIKILRK